MGSTLEEALERGGELDEAAIRLALDAALGTGLTLSTIARQAGLGISTLHAWKGGKYNGRSETVAEKVQRWLDAQAARAGTRAALPPAPGFVMTKTASRFWEVLEHAQHMPDLVVIAGGAGVGKTTACKGYQAQSSNVWIVTMEPCISSTSNFLTALAETLEVTERGSPQRLSRAIVRKLVGTAGLLIIDEAQHLSSQALDQLRTIHDLAEIGIAVVGNETVFARFGAEHRTAQFAQLYSRIGMRITRPKPLAADINMLLDAWKIGGQAERKLVLAIALRPGGARGMTKMLRMAFGLASTEGLSSPNCSHIEIAWSQLGNQLVDGPTR